jgi:hypothetical protein
MIDIKYLPKDILLYELWKRARLSQYFYHCKEKAPRLNIERCRNDINHMFINNKNIEVTIYYGRLIYINLTDNEVDTFNYNVYNGSEAAEEVINEIKKNQMNKVQLNYYKSR